jgi:hypothetical protein
MWASLARDYLSIMASSVSSERAFSQGGITISKHCSRLKGDIVEALQCVRCTIRHDLLFCEMELSSIGEDKLDVPDDFEESDDPGDSLQDGDAVREEEEGWDSLLLEEDEDLELDAEMD